MAVTKQEQLWQAFWEGRTADAKRALVVQYLDLVRYVVARLGRPAAVTGKTLETEDMVQYGVLGLIEAIDRYQPAPGVKFETYAIPRIRGSILDELRGLDWVPRSVRTNARRVEVAADRLAQEAGREAAHQEIAGRLSMSVDDLQKILKEGTQAVSSARPYSADDPAVADRVAEEGPNALEQLSDEQGRTMLVEAIAGLPERSRTVIALYYYEGLKFGDIARVLRVSESRISQIHAEVLRDLRKQLAALA